jgi:hypothetical protein
MPGDMNHLYDNKKTIVTIVSPNDEKIEVDFYFSTEEVYTVDGWYSCLETDGEWYILKGKTIFTWEREDKKLGRLYYSPEFGFSTKDECELLLRLKAFW